MLPNKLNIFINYIKTQNFKNAAELLQTCNQQEVEVALATMHTTIQFQIHSISILKRELKPNITYKDFYQAWLPPMDTKNITTTNTGVSASYFPFSVRVVNAVNIKNNKEIISIGLMSATKEEIENLNSNKNPEIKELLKTEAIRHEQIEKISIKMNDTEFFECKDDNNLG